MYKVISSMINRDVTLIDTRLKDITKPSLTLPSLLTNIVVMRLSYLIPMGI